MTIYIFTASFCQPCKRLKESLAEFPEYVTQKNIQFKDIEQDFELALKYNIRTAPTVLVIKDNEPDEMYIGISETSQLKKVLGDE